MRGETIVILAGGTWGRVERLRPVVASAGYVIAADGGYSKAIEHGIRVDEVVGDLDSVRAGDRARLAEDEGPSVHVHERDKDWTDLELALEFALRRTPAEIVVFGGVGKRLDHTLTAVHLLEKGLEGGVPISLVSGRETIRLIDGELKLDAAAGDRVSLIPLSESSRASTTGLRFALRGERLSRAASRGVSNDVVGSDVRVTVHEGLLLVVHARRGGSDG